MPVLLSDSVMYLVDFQKHFCVPVENFRVQIEF